jgi:hypothetical protein
MQLLDDVFALGYLTVLLYRQQQGFCYRRHRPVLLLYLLCWCHRLAARFFARGEPSGSGTASSLPASFRQPFSQTLPALFDVRDGRQPEGLFGRERAALRRLAKQ